MFGIFGDVADWVGDLLGTRIGQLGMGLYGAGQDQEAIDEYNRVVLGDWQRGQAQRDLLRGRVMGGQDPYGRLESWDLTPYGEVDVQHPHGFPTTARPLGGGADSGMYGGYEGIVPLTRDLLAQYGTAAEEARSEWDVLAADFAGRYDERYNAFMEDWDRYQGNLIGTSGRFGRSVLEDIEQRGGELVGGYGERLERGMGMLEGLGGQARRDVEARHEALLGGSMADLAARGLSGTTVLESARRGHASDLEADMRRLEEDLRREQFDAYTGLSGDVLGAREAVAERYGDAASDWRQRTLDLMESSYLNRGEWEAELGGEALAMRGALAEAGYGIGEDWRNRLLTEGERLRRLPMEYDIAFTEGDLAWLQELERMPPSQSFWSQQAALPLDSEVEESGAGWGEAAGALFGGAGDIAGMFQGGGQRPRTSGGKPPTAKRAWWR